MTHRKFIYVGTSGHLGNAPYKDERARDFIFDVRDGSFGEQNVAISCGGAPSGWDLAVIKQACVYDVPLALRLPFITHFLPKEYVQYARKTTGIATCFAIAYTGGNESYFGRNQEIIEDAESSGWMTFFYDGRIEGGTYYTFIRSKHLDTINYYEI